MQESEDDLSLVQLGRTADVRPELLEGAGSPLGELVVDVQVTPLGLGAAEAWEARLATPGWRVVDERSPGGHPRRVLAAPDETEEGIWQVLVVTQRDGKCQLSSHHRAQRDRPGRPYRRRHLRLTWAEDEFTVARGELPVLTAVLTNAGPEAWNEDGEEATRVVAWLYRGEEELPATHWVAYAPLADPHTALGPGEAVRVDAQLLTKDVEAPAVGIYEAKGFLAPLNLWSSVGRLRVA